MRYDDASQAGSTASDNAPVARADVANLPQGSFGPENGNVITGAGTVSGAAGADSPGDGPTTVVDVHGAGGQTTGADGHFQALGQYGVLNMDAEGNFSYVRNAGTPDGVQDAFSYTIADKDGQTSSTTLAMNVGAAAQAAVTIPGVVNLPPGVELSDIRVSGRDLIITLPDGSHMTIPGGAVFVPQLVIGDVQVPPSNLAALLIESEPQPAANALQSSGGNFESPVPPLDPGVPLGDLIPPTELAFTPPEFRDINQFEDTEPTVVIVTPDNPAGAVDASESVFEKGLPARGSEPEGSGEEAAAGANGDPSEATTGTIVFQAQDGLQSITIDGIGDSGNQGAVTITAGSVGTVIHGQYGDLTITSVNFATGEIGYSYVLLDNTSGDNTADHFTVVVTDSDGDQATATLTVHIVDDVPTARNDTDSLDDNHTATGNVMTGTGTTSGAAGHDTVGADNAHLTGVSGTGGSDTTFDGSGNLVVHGTFGTLTIDANGNYTYVLDQGSHGGGNDVFTYTITDGDGDTSQATLTINVPRVNTPPVAEGSAIAVSEEGLPGGNPDSTGNPTDTTDEHQLSGSITISDADGDSLTVKLAVPNPDPNFTSGGETVHWALSPDGQTLTGYTGLDPSTNHVITITIDNNGDYTVNLTAPIDHPNDDGEQVASFTIPVDVSDGVAHTPTTIVVSIEDDSPIVDPTVNTDATVSLDETGPAVAATIDTGIYAKGNDPDVAGSGAISKATSGTAIVDANAAFGGDGPAASDSLTYALTITDASSGLTLTDGSAINLVMQDGVIVGVVSGGAFDGQAAFAISIDANTGVVTVEQYLSLHHDSPDLGDSNEADIMGAGHIGVTVTATDADGDQATSGAVDISGQISFHDDGPSAAPTLNTDATVSLDETGPAVAATIDTGVYAKGNDPDVAGSGAISKATSGTAVVDGHAAFGADGPATSDSLTYALSITNAASGLTLTDGSAINLVMQDGVIVGVVSGGAFDGQAAFAIAINPSTGVVTVEQYLSLAHDSADVGDSNEAEIMSAGHIGVTVTATDGDGDHVTSDAVDISGQISFHDDGPSLTNVSGQSSITVDETTEGDITGWATPLTGTSAAPMITATEAFGADGPAVTGSVAYGLTLAGNVSSLSSGLQTAQGDHAITLVQTNATTITGVYQDGGSHTAFTIVMNADGTVTYTQYVPLEHSDAGSSAIALNDTNSPINFDGLVNATITITDGDGDTATGSTNIGDQIQVFDDGPTAIDPDSITTTNEAQSVITASLDIGDNNVIDNFGADGPGTITFANITNGQDSGFTSGGDAITYWLSDNGQTLEGRTGSTDGTDGTLIFTVHIDQADSQYDYTQYAPVDNGSGISFDDLSSTHAGNVNFAGVGVGVTPPSGPDADLLISGTNSVGGAGSVNTDSDSIGIANQSMDVGETTRIDFVTGMTTAGGNPTGFDFTGHLTTQGFIGLIPQVQGNQATTVDFTVYALNTSLTGSGTPDSNPTGGFSDSSIVQVTSVYAQDYLTGNTATVDITSLSAGQTIAVGSFGVTVTKNADGSVTFHGIQEGDHYGINTGTDFNAIAVHDDVGSFDLGIFSLTTTNFGDPVHLNYDLQITDADGDFVPLPGAIDITLEPTGVVNSSLSTLSATSVNESSFDSSSLYANDNTGHGNNRDAGSNSILMGALAAAGLGSETPAAASSHDSASDQSVDDSTTSSVAGTQSVTSEGDGSSSSSSSDSQLLGDVGGKHDSAPDHSSQANNDNAKGGDTSVSNEQADAHAPADLPQGTDAPTQDSGSSPVTAAGIVMPSLEDLAGHSGGKAEGQQHNEVVGKVLADALHGGGGEGPNVESLINSLPGHGGGHGDHGNAALEALASHGAAAVPNGDTGVFAGFSGGHGMHMMEQMTMHQDAAPAHA